MKNVLKMSIVYLVLVATQSFASAPAAAQQEGTNTYNGQKIDAKTIFKIAPKAPQEVEKAAQQWMRQHPDVINALLDYTPLTGDVAPLRQSMANAKIKLQENGIQNTSNANYVFSLPTDSNWLVKIAGIPNRRENVRTLINQGFLKQSEHLPYGSPMTEEHGEILAAGLQDDEFDRVIVPGGIFVAVSTAPKTYQTISRVANYLLFLEAKKKHDFQHVTTPDAYLVHIPGRPTDVSDRNYIVVEKKNESLQPVDTLTPAEFKEVKTTIEEVGLFDINKGNLMKKSDEALSVHDLEQPNNSNPRDFLNKKRSVFEGNVRAGLEGLNGNFTIKE